MMGINHFGVTAGVTYTLPIVFFFVSTLGAQGNYSEGTRAESHFNYLDLLFNKYAIDGKLCYGAFQELLENLGFRNGHLDVLEDFIERHLEDSDHHHEDHDHHSHDHEDHDDHGHGHENHPSRLRKPKILHTDVLGKTYNKTGTEHGDPEAGQVKCLSSEQLWSSHGHSTDNTLDRVQFLHLLPAVIYQLDPTSTMCLVLAEDQPHEEHHHAAELEVWLYAIVAVVVISLCGVFGVAVIPIMHKTLYHHMLQFLVALAVGSLSGDALLHLLPHAMLPAHGHGEGHGDEHKGHEDTAHERSPDAEREIVLKGLAALAGFFFFFLMEKLIAVLAECRNSMKAKSPILEMKNRSERMVGKKLSKHHQYTTYSYNLEDVGLTPKQAEQESCSQTSMGHYNCYEKNADENGDCRTPNQCNSPNKSEKIVFPPDDSERNHVDHSHEPLMSGGDSNMNRHYQADVSPLFGKKLPDTSITLSNSLKPPNHLPIPNGSFQGEDLPGDEEEDDEDLPPRIIITTHENMHHGHSHAHGHVHSRPTSVVAVAWMVIMGDGIHNFTDGLIMGAAFASSITGGLSTSIAVFCHELPHELGDFAVLLKTGMSWKQALFYNGVSSILCLIGVIAGVLLGRMENVEPWVFACAAGMFLYIALVDMIPELNHLPPGVRMNQGSQLLLQCLGMITGGCIMLTIAFNEHALRNLFNE